MRTHDSLMLLAWCAAARGSGVAGLNASHRIVGGEIVDDPTAYPYIVSLLTEVTSTTVAPFCGGSLIADEWVLTAAHCILPDKPVSFVMIGDLHLSEDDAGAELRSAVSQIYVHPDYRSSENGAALDDIALLRLESPVGGKIKPVRLIESVDQEKVGETLSVAGFGRLYDAGPDDDTYSCSRCGISCGGESVCVNGYTSCDQALCRSDPAVGHELRHVDVTYMQPSKCTSIFGPANFNTREMICAGSLEENKDSCQGDSGGPLVNSNNVQIGIVSWGAGCARAGVPGAYTRISSYLSYIESVTNLDFDDNPDNNNNFDQDTFRLSLDLIFVAAAGAAVLCCCMCCVGACVRKSRAGGNDKKPNTNPPTPQSFPQPQYASHHPQAGASHQQWQQYPQANAQPMHGTPQVYMVQQSHGNGANSSAPYPTAHVVGT